MRFSDFISGFQGCYDIRPAPVADRFRCIATFLLDRLSVSSCAVVTKNLDKSTFTPEDLAFVLDVLSIWRWLSISGLYSVINAETYLDGLSHKHTQDYSDAVLECTCEVRRRMPHSVFYRVHVEISPPEDDNNEETRRRRNRGRVPRGASIFHGKAELADVNLKLMEGIASLTKSQRGIFLKWRPLSAKETTVLNTICHLQDQLENHEDTCPTCYRSQRLVAFGCKHAMCMHCVVRWKSVCDATSRHVTCPLCRRDIM